MAATTPLPLVCFAQAMGTSIAACGAALCTGVHKVVHNCAQALEHVGQSCALSLFLTIRRRMPHEILCIAQFSPRIRSPPPIRSDSNGSEPFSKVMAREWPIENGLDPSTYVHTCAQDCPTRPLLLHKYLCTICAQLVHNCTQVCTLVHTCAHLCTHLRGMFVHSCARICAQLCTSTGKR